MTVDVASQSVKHLEYVLADSSIYLYSIDEDNRLVQRINLPQIRPFDPRFRGQPAGRDALHLVRQPGATRRLTPGLRPPTEPSCLAARLSRRNRQHGDQRRWPRDLHACRGRLGRRNLADHRCPYWLADRRRYQRRRRRPQHDHGCQRRARLPRWRRLPVPHRCEHDKQGGGARDRAARTVRCPTVHDQRFRDTRVHYRKELPRIRGQ